MKINIKYPTGTYDVYIEKNILANITDYIDFPNKVMIITDSMIPWFYCDDIKKAKNDVIIHKIKYGEASKSFENYQEIITKLLTNEFTKSDMIIAIGGGVVGDLSGYVASTYKRGLRLIHVPTSLLAMVDSSIGGKCALNYNGVKNVIGTYYMPEKVLISLDTLKTLPKRQFFNGLMEAVKTGILGDEKLFNLIKEENTNSILTKAEEIVTRSVLVKKKIVEKDPYELNVRRYLNLGHTIGHAIEIINMGTILHGEAVALGMLPFVPNRKELSLIISKYIPIANIDITKTIIIDKIKNDKKWENGLLDIIYVKNIGKPEIKKYTLNEIEECINDIHFW